MRFIFCRFLFVFWVIFSDFSHANFDKSVVSQVRLGVVVINTRTAFSAYEASGISEATGFFVDTEKGLIVTNKHVVGEGSISTYEVVLQDGRQLDARCLYMDPWQDFAILRLVNPEKISATVRALPLKPKGAGERMSVFMVGNNEAQNSSFQTGEVSSLYDTSGCMPTQALRISLNTRGGASGSPVCNEKGQVIALTHSASDTSAFALPIEFICDALDSLRQGKTPPRRGTGMLVDYVSLEQIAKVTDISEPFVTDYSKKYPKASYKTLYVESVFEDSPAYGKIFPADLILKIEGQELGPDFYRLDKIMNDCKKEAVNLTILREGKPLNVLVNLYDLHQYQIRQMVLFGGALFYEADERERRLMGAKGGDILIRNAQPGSSFANTLPSDMSFPFRDRWFAVGGVRVERLNFKPLKTLDDLVHLAPLLMKRQRFAIEFSPYGPTVQCGHPQVSRILIAREVVFNKLDGPARVFTFNPSTLTWDVRLTSFEEDTLSSN